MAVKQPEITEVNLRETLDTVGAATTWKWIQEQALAAQADPIRRAREEQRKQDRIWESGIEKAGTGVSVLLIVLALWIVVQLCMLPWKNGQAYDRAQLQACSDGNTVLCLDAVHQQETKHLNAERARLLRGAYKVKTGKSLPPLPGQPVHYFRGGLDITETVTGIKVRKNDLEIDIQADATQPDPRIKRKEPEDGQ